MAAEKAEGCKMKFLKNKLSRAGFCLCCGLFFISCTTTVYYPVHQFAKKTRVPEKRGVVEFAVSKARALSPPPGVIADLETARKKGRREAERLIKNFCESGFSILNVSSETRQDGWTGLTSSVFGSHTGVFALTTLSPVYNQYTQITFKCNS